MDDDHYQSSLPDYCAPHVVGADMADTLGNDHSNFLDSSEYLLDGVQDNDYAEFIPHKSPPTALMPDATSATVSPSQGSSSDSQSNSLDASDSSSGGASMAGKRPVPGRIPIPADGTDEQSTPHLGPNLPGEDSCIGNELFDFDSAASSPSNIPHHPSTGRLKMPIRSGLNNGPLNFGFHRQDTPEIFPTDFASHYPSQHTQQPPEAPTQFVNGSFLHRPISEGPLSPSPSTTIKTHSSPIPGEETYIHPTLHASALPKTQRVETQMHVRLTMWPLPPGISRLHFQTHTMARTKLVMKPPPQRSPSMIELHAHCVCATPMEHPEKRRQAFERAAKDARHGFVQSNDAGTSSRSLQMADNDPNKPINGGFVFICDQCIRRENKRLGRKKLKNEEEEESWLEDQPKRIIVFNRAEVMDWQNWSSYEDEEEVDDAASGAGSGKAHFPDHAMQIRFPMRIQCYSRHHGEKLGYRVIFTMTDWQNNLIAQTMTSASIITDDHKAQHSAKLSGDISTTGFSGGSDTASLGGLPPSQPTYYGFPLSNRNSFSSPDLQSLQLSNPSRSPQFQNLAGSMGDFQRLNGGQPPSRNASRPASPSTPFAPQSKRRKGSGNGINRIRSDLMMTRITPSSPASPFSPDRQASGPSFLAEQQLQQQLSPNFTLSHGFPNASGYGNSHPPTPSGSSQQFHQRSQSVEDLQSYQQPSSMPTSAWQSQAPSVNGSPQPYPQALIPEEPMTRPTTAASYEAATQKTPVIRKVTPSDGPTAGGIEVTCLGEGFVAGSKVLFGDVMATTTTVWSDAALVCLLPPAARPGFVKVTVYNPDALTTNQSSHERVPFKYIDNEEESLMRQTLQLLNQQFTGGSIEASEFTQKVLHSLRRPLAADNKGTAFGQAQSNNHAKSYAQQELQHIVIGALEIIDLDVKPKRADLNTRGPGGQSLLHSAAFLDLYRLVASLLARGANVDVRDNNGLTPLHMASLQGNAMVIRKLRSSGSDPTIRSLDGVRAADLAPSPIVRNTIDDLGFPSPFSSKGLAQQTPDKSINGVHPAEYLPETDIKVPLSAPRSLDIDPLDPGNGKGCIAETAEAFSSWHRSKLLSPLSDSRVSKQSPKAGIGADAAALAASPALSAWRDQILAQVHQLQQSLQRVLPLVPAMPDYQAHSVMRRISSLVPQRAFRQEAVPDAGKMADVDYHWWELITGAVSAPPAYEEIYPSKETGMSSVRDVPRQSPANAFVATNVKPTEVASHPSERSIIDTLNIDRDIITQEQQQQIREAYARKVKRLRSDRNLFFIWIPLLLLIIFAMLKDRAADLISCGAQVRAFLGNVVGRANAAPV